MMGLFSAHLLDDKGIKVSALPSWGEGGPTVKLEIGDHNLYLDPEIARSTAHEILAACDDLTALPEDGAA